MSARRARRRVATALFAVLLSPILATFLSMPGATAAAPLPVVTLDAPAGPLIGENVAFDVSFVNGPGADAGYGPYVDLSLPLGADLNDGLTFIGATYLGADVTSTVLTANLSGCVTHPYAVGVSGAPVTMCGLAVGQQYVVLRLPFGSFTPGQPAATVHVTTHLSNLADAGTALTIGARGGYQFGATPLADPATDPSIIGDLTTATVTPTIMRITKTYHGPEDETATGPNYPRSYTLDVTVAPGQTVTNLTVTDTLPGTIQYISTDTPTLPDPPISSLTEPSTSTPGGTLSATFNTIHGTGGTDATVTFHFYVPRLDSGTPPVPVLAPDTGAFNTSTDSAGATATWSPVDPRDGTNVAVAAGPATHTLTDKSIAVQKTVALAVDTGPAGVSPGDTLEWTISIQISDYFALDTVVVDDLLGDGTRVDPSFKPTLAVAGNGYVSDAGEMAVANYTVSPVDGISGKTPISFRVSNELVTRGHDGRMVGGCVDPAGSPTPPDCSYNDGATTATIVFRSIVQRTYIDNVTEVVEGDTLRNEAAATGIVLDTGTFESTHHTVGDGSAGVATAGTSASISIDRGTLEKSIYAVNGHAPLPGPVHVSPGDTVTYRLQQIFPTSRTDSFRIIDYLPLPVFYASAVTFDDVVDATAPAAGHAKYGPSDTFHTLHTLTPTVSSDPVANSVQFLYGDYAADPAVLSRADILFTVTVSTSPFADGLLLTNQARSETKNSVGTLQTADAIVQITLDQPVMAITKGVVGTDNPHGVFAPATTGPVTFDPTAAPPAAGTCPRFSGGPITSANLAAHPINSNLSGVDAGDYVRFAVVLENTGHAAAFAVEVKDTIPTGFDPLVGAVDVCVTDGAGTALATTNVGGGTGLFDKGIELFGAGDGSLAPGISDGGINGAGTNIVVISYTLKVDASAVPKSVATNTATLFNFANDPGAPNHLGSALTDTATVTMASPTLAKTLTGTSLNHGTAVAVGEIVTYQVVVTVPEGTMPATTVVDTLPSGLALVDCSPIAASAGVTSSVVTFDAACVAGTNPTVGTGGQLVTFNLGTVTNANSSNDTPETITITYRAVVLNVAGNVRSPNKNLHNSAALSWTGGSLSPVSAADVHVVEPKLAVGKTASPGAGDAGDTILFTITVTNSTITNGADAYDVTLTDVVPPGMTLASTLTQVDGPVATITVVGTNLSATWDTFAQGQTAHFQFSATIDYSATPGEVFTNTANAAWTSIPGDKHSSPQSTFNAVSTERTGDTGNPGANLNNYRASHSATATVPLATVTKTMTDTNQAHTSGSSVAVGEIVTYQLALTIPEGTEPAAKLIDTLPSGLALVDCSPITASAGVTSSVVTFGAPCVAGTNPTGGTGGQLVTFDFGTIANSNNDPAVETITVTYRAVVLNLGTNVHGTTLHNSAVLSWTGNHSATASADDVTVVEPIMTLGKTRSPATGDAGDPITFTINIANPSVSNNTDAFEVVWSDTIPAGLTYVPGSLVCTAGTCPVLDASAAPTLRATWATFGLTNAATLSYRATLDANVPSGASYTNTATLTWTSLPGNVTSPQSTFNGVSTERTGDTNNPGGAANTYKLTSSATVTVPQPVPVKKLVCTSEAGTATTHVAVGEIARFRVAVVIPEGVTPSVSITDALPAGLRFLNDGKATVAFVTNGGGAGLTSSIPALSGSGLAVAGDDTWAGDPTFAIPAGQIGGGPFGDGTDPTFNLGTLTNADRDPDAEMVVIEFNVLVDNVAGNTAGAALADGATVYSNGTALADPGTATITVAEPSVTLTKTITTTPIDGGDTIVYHIAITNGSGDNVSPAYDVHVNDPLDPNLTLVSAVATGDSGVTNATNYGTGVVDYTFDAIAPGATETIDITAKVSDNVDAGRVIPNTAGAAWTSLPGPQGTTSNPTGSSTPTGSGTDTGERDGSGGVNSYHATSAASTTLAVPSVAKLGPADPTRAIGATTTFDIVVTLPEGTTRGLVVVDTLPAGLTPVNAEIITSQAASGGHLTDDYGGALTLPIPSINSPGGPGGGAWTFTFRDTYLAPNGSSDNNSFLIRITVQVANVVANQSGSVLTNTAGVRYTDPGTAGVQTIAAPQSPSVTVIEPVLAVSKSADDTTPRFGATVTYTLTLSHTGASNADAFDVVLTDTLPSGMTLRPLTLQNTAGLAPSATPTVAGNTITIHFDSFPLGSTSTFTYEAVVGNAGTVSLKQTLTNQVGATWTSLAGSVTGERTGADGVNGALNDYAAATSAPVVVSGIDLTLSKTDNRDTAIAGATLTYDITYQNVGNDTATGVKITETIPVGTTYTGSGWTCADGNGAGKTCTLTIGSVGPGVSGTVHFAVTVVDPVPPSLTHIHNTASVADGGGMNADPTPDNNTAVDDDPIPEADLSLTKTVNDPTPNAGEVVVFTIKVHNTGPDPATGVKVTDTLPGSLSFDSADAGGGSYNSGTGVWTVPTIPVGSDAILILRAKVNTRDSATNVAEVTHADQYDPDSTPGNGPGEDDYATAKVDPKVADLSVTKVAAPEHPNVGADVTFTITATNHGPSDATGVKVTDHLPAGLLYKSSSATKGSYDSGTGVWTIDDLANGHFETLTLVATVNSSDPITNTATIGGDQFDSDLSNNTSTIETSQEVDLEVTKTVDHPAANVGTTATFIVTVINHGPDTANDVVIHDAWSPSAGLTFGSAETSGTTTYVSSTGTWTVGTLANGASATLTIHVTVAGAAPTTNTASVQHVDETQSDLTNDQASAKVTPPQADLAITKVVAAPRPAGNTDFFTITVTNKGPDKATGVVVTDLLPPGLTLVSSDVGQGTFDSATGKWSVGDLENGAHATLVLHVTVDAEGNYTNTATVTADQYDPDPTNNTASDSLSTRVVDIVVTKTANNGAPAVGTTVTFTVSARNDGPDDATQLVIHDALPAGLTYVSSTPSVGAYDSNTGDWTIGDLAHDTTVTLDITARVVGSGPIVNTASVTGLLQKDSNHANDTDSATIDPPAAADLALTKTVDKSTPDMGTNVVFTVTVTNHGPDGTTGVHVRDLLPAGMTYVSSDPSVGIYDPTTGDWNIGDMANGDVETIAITATVDVEGPLTNMAEVTASELPDPNSTVDNHDPGENDQDSVQLNARGVADLSVTKVARPAALHKGDQTTYTIVVTNNGPDGATGVIVRDQLPAAVTYVSSSGGNYNPTTGAWTVGSLGVGSSATLTITVRVGQTGSIANTATVVASDQRDPNPTNDQASAGVAAGGATLPPTLTNAGASTPSEPGSLALWFLGTAFAGITLIASDWLITRNRRYRRHPSIEPDDGDP